MPMLRFMSVAVVTLSALRASHAASPSDGWLAWSPASTECGGASAFAARVERALGRSPERTAAEAHVNVTAQAAPAPAGGVPRWVGQVHLRGDDQRDLGSRTIDRGDTSCASLIDALAVVTALALADDGLVAPEPAISPGQGPPPGAPAVREDRTNPPAVLPTLPDVTPAVAPVTSTERPAAVPTPAAPVPPASSDPPATALREPAPLPPRTDAVAEKEGAQPLPRAARRWRSRIEAGPTMGFGLLPRAAFGAEIAAYLGPASGWKLSLSFQGWQRQTILDQLGRGASLQRLTVGLGVCPATVSRGAWEGTACLAGGVGRLGVSGVNIAMSSTGDRLTLNAGLGVQVMRRLVGPLAAGLTAGAEVPLIRDRVGYSTTDGTVVSLFRESPIEAIVAFRLSFAF